MLNRIKNWAAKWLIEEAGWINISIGVLAAGLVPILIPLQNVPPLVGQILWGFAFFFGTEFVKIVRKVPEQVKRALDQHENTVANSFYRGFYVLCSDKALRQELEKFDSALADTAIGGELRDLVFGFMARSIAMLGKSGLAMVNVSVKEYVNLLKRVLALPDLTFRATCTVRPYWFMTDGIPQICLNPSEKAAHLPYFNNQRNPLRIAVFDETMIAEILLTSLIERKIYETDKENCPVCQKVEGDCPIHKERSPYNTSTSSQIPEITWFEGQVNNNVQLLYTHVHTSFKESCSELEDRVYITDNRNLKMDIRFNFTNLSTGIVWLRWGDKAQDFPEPIDSSSSNVRHLNIGSEQVSSPSRSHALYNVFWDPSRRRNCLLHTARFDCSAIKVHLGMLNQLVAQYFNEQTCRELISDVEYRNLLAEGHKDFKVLITGAINDLMNTLDKGGIYECYKQSVEWYAKNGQSEIAYVVTYDKKQPNCPVRLAQWKKNWEALTKANY
ncbi:MAG: hypothetical protein QXD69_02565 [Candidatus Bathyarchaeia archaeon]